MAHSALLLSVLVFALPLTSATPTWGNQAQSRNSETSIDLSNYLALENDTLNQNPFTLQSYPSDCPAECGIRGGSGAANPDEKIVGGEAAEKDEFPWRCLITAKFLTGEDARCGCTVLSQNWVLTAAHCLVGFKDFQVFAGLLDRSKKTSADYQSGSAVQVINHESFDPKTFNNDIALIKLNRSITFQPSIKPACLPYKMKSEPGEGMVTASGWGATKWNDTNYPNILRKLDLPLISRQQCRKYLGKDTITDNMICTYKDGKDVCSGDSGGSIDYLDRDGRYKSIGIVSFGDECAKKNRPGVYVDVTKYLGWISQQTGRTFCG